MSTQLQEGIYYRAKPKIGNSFCMLTLRSENATQIIEIGNTMSHIWKHIEHLKMGILSDLNIDQKHRKNGNMTALVAYGRDLFDVAGSRKQKPSSFTNWNFKPPKPEGGGDIIHGSGMTYSDQTLDNHLLFDHIILQFVADSEFYTNRAAIEVWKVLNRVQKKVGISPLHITGLYTGFQRPDYRNWFGFHDGVSNMRSHERAHAIIINSRDLHSKDKWTFNGTYLAFMRISLDMKKWENTDVLEQEIIIGRDKLTGCPLIGVDKNGKPVKDFRCPVPGTSEIIDRGNERFRDHPPYGIRPQDSILRNSHIGRTRPIDRLPIWHKNSLRIYRQGFEFLVPSQGRIGFDAGLNFVSFQNTPERFFRALTYQHTVTRKSSGTTSLDNLNRFMSVLAAGIFFVPPRVQNEPFPGAAIFFNNTELRKLISNKNLNDN